MTQRSNSSAIQLPTVDDDGVFKLLVIAGGGRQASELHWRRAKVDFVMVFDNHVEIARMEREFPARDNIRFFPLAVGETADTLARHGSEDMKALIRSRASMNAVFGLGQIPGVGFLAAEQLKPSTAFKDLLGMIRHEAGIRTKGRPVLIVIRLVGSTAGGTAAGIVEMIAQALGEALQINGVSVETEIDLIDATTFLGLGSRCGLNSASTIAELSAWCCSKGGNPLDGVTRSLSLMALPPFRHDGQARSELVALDEQAITCSEMQALLAMIRPNHSLDSPLGTIVHRQVDFFRTLHPEVEVANEVAHYYLPQITAAIASATVCRALLKGVFTDTTSTPIGRDEIPSLMDDIAILSDVELQEAVERPRERLTCSATAETATDEVYHLERVDEEFLIPPTTLDEATARLSMLRTIERFVTDEISIVSNELNGLAHRYGETAAKFSKALQRVRRPRLWHLKSQARRWDDLLNVAEALRADRDAMRPLEAILEALQRGQKAVTRVLQAHQEHLENIRRAISLFRPRGYALPTNRSAEIRDVNDAFSELSLLPTAERDRQTWILASQVVYVTVDGLSRVLNIDEPRIDLIAERIISGPPQHIGPYLGASRHAEGGRLVYCLPPMMQVPRMELKRVLQERMPTATIVFADFAAAGINVLRYRFFRPSTVRELFPGMLERDLQDAIRDDLKPLFFPHGDERLMQLGLLPSAPQLDGAGNQKVDGESVEAEPQT
jgi:hypothetical protein